MARINLLPWREELRKQKKQDFLTAMGVLAGATLVSFIFVHTYIQGLHTYQEKRNQMLSSEIAALDLKLGEIKNIEDTRNKLLKKIELIQGLQRSRPEVVHLFDEIPRAAPEGVFLTKFIQTGKDLVFEGKSKSNARVSAFMREIDASNWLHTPMLEVIKTPDDKVVLSDFTLKATLGKPNADTANLQTTPTKK